MHRLSKISLLCLTLLSGAVFMPSQGNAAVFPAGLGIELPSPGVETVAVRRSRTVVRRTSVRPGRPVVRPGRPIARPGRPIVRPGAVRRPVVVVRPWRSRPHYGRLIAGVALGAVITAAVIGSVPAAPAPDLCWYWTSSYQNEGYWDYCR